MSNQQPSIEQVITNMRDNILRSQSQASTTCITSFDNMVQQMQVFAMQINDKNAELTRLQELCKKNNIDFAVPPVKKPVTVQTPKPKAKA